MGLVATAARGRGLSAALVASSLIVAGAVMPAVAAPPKAVLILAEGPVAPYVAELRQILSAAIRHDSAEPLNIYEEVIDRIRFDSEDYDRQLLALYQAKYHNTPPDLVVTITEPALDFALRHQNDLFPHAPILFGAVDERVTDGRILGANITGVFHHYDARATVEAALALHPATRRIIVVGGASRLDRGYLDVTKEDLGGLVSQTAITYISDKPLNDVLALVAGLRDDAIVLFLSMQSDGDSVARSGPEVLAALRQAAKVPIYGMSGNVLGRGIVGGMLFDVQSHGADLAQRARQLLSGSRATDLVAMRSANTLSFDAIELKRFGIDETRIPARARIINREVGLWATYRDTIVVVSAVVFGQSVLIGGLLVQRHRRRSAERALRDLSGRLLSAQEDERRRIARELHDNVSQQMAVLAIELDDVAMRPHDPPAVVAGSLRKLRQRATEISTEIHNLSHQLHSSKLEMLGLVEALRGHGQELASHGVRVAIHDEQVPQSLSPEIALCLYRIVQEALNNVVKHSGAAEAAVTLRASKGVLVVSVADGGRGFDETSEDAQGGLGLASMRERLRLVDGQLTVRSQPGHGTTITASAPILETQARAAATPHVA